MRQFCVDFDSGEVGWWIDTELQNRFQPMPRFRFRFLSVDGGFPKSRLWKRKWDMD